MKEQPGERPPEKGIEEALLDANRIAFGPLMFQAARSLWKRGVLESLRRNRTGRCDAARVAQETGLSAYAVRLLLDAGQSLDLVRREGEDYRITKTGCIWLADRTVQVNADFVHDLCYRAFFRFEEAIVEGYPAGLREFGDWPTIYPAIPGLPEPARSSWYAFDHRYSDSAFAQALELLAAHAPRRVLDVGGNTGRFARALAGRLPQASVCIVDLPEQIQQARRALAGSTVEFVAADLLADAGLPTGFDAVWVSQFLDCFSEEQASAILRRLRGSLAPGASLFVLEPCPDDQRFAAASYSLNATSLYFACIANGNSRLYCVSDWERMFAAAGLRVAERHSGLGICQTLFRCVPA